MLTSRFERKEKWLKDFGGPRPPKKAPLAKKMYYESLWNYIMVKCLNIVCTLVFVHVFLMVIPAAADYAPPGGSSGGNLELSGDTTTVSITVSNNITEWGLHPGDNTCVGVLKVSADGNWQVAAVDNSLTTDGHMTEWYDGSYLTDPKKLASAMSVSVQPTGSITTGDEVELPGGGMIAMGGDTSGEISVDVTFKQSVSWNDYALTNGHSYRMVITFTISPYS